jgi:hypothetical protein
MITRHIDSTTLGTIYRQKILKESVDDYNELARILDKYSFESEDDYINAGKELSETIKSNPSWMNIDDKTEVMEMLHDLVKGTDIDLDELQLQIYGPLGQDSWDTFEDEEINKQAPYGYHAPFDEWC